MKVRISLWWVLCLPLVLTTHTYKVLLFVFSLLSIHELMHVLAAHLLAYRIEKVCVYPIGLSASICDFEYRKSLYEIVITLAGLSVHVLVYFLLPYLVGWHLFSVPFMQYLNRINIQLLCFNLLPIYPLDGGRLMRNLLEFFFPIKTARMGSLFLSCGCLLFFIYQGALAYPSGIFMMVFFGFQLLMECFLFTSRLKEFYLYRYLHGIQAKWKIHDKSDIYKNRYNLISTKHGIKSEKEVLKKFF